MPSKDARVVLMHPRREDLPDQALDPSLPVLEMLSADPPPKATAPLLVTAHGTPIGFVPEDDPDPRAAAEAAFAEALALHRAEKRPCSWQAVLGSDRPAVTVAVSTIGERPGPLNVLLQSLLAQTYAPLEVVVVDNRPGTWDHDDLLKSRRVRVVEEPVKGLSAARNRGIASAVTPIVLLLDDDIMPAPDWAGWLVAGLHATEETACVTGLILPLDTRTAGQRLLEEWGGYGKGLERKVHQHPHPNPPSVLYPYQPGAFGSGASVGFWTDAVRELGGFDEALGAGTPAHGGEDLAMQMNVVLSGKHLVYEPRSVVWHRHRATEKEWQRQLFWYGAGLSAAMLRQALSSPRHLLALVRRFPAGIRHMTSKDSVRQANRSSSYPRKLVVTEWLGILVGPFALLRSVVERSRR